MISNFSCGSVNPRLPNVHLQIFSPTLLRATNDYSYIPQFNLSSSFLFPLTCSPLKTFPRKGFRTSLISSFTPWILVYVPIPLGLLNGAWSFHCARAGHIKYQATGSCVSRAGLCGTAWGCSGPSCALNLGLDLGLFITALLAAVPAGAAPRGCGYTCVTFLCFPCAPVGGEGLAVFMVFAALALAVGAATKMWVMAKAMKERGVPGLRREEFLPW